MTSELNRVRAEQARNGEKAGSPGRRVAGAGQLPIKRASMWGLDVPAPMTRGIRVGLLAQTRVRRSKPPAPRGLRS